MKAIVILADSINRHFLNIYRPESGVETPSLERLRAQSVVFDNHWVGSAPCMPARRDMLTGRLNFLERNWGPIEPFDYTLPRALRGQGIYSHMITDHYHYWETGGENYCQAFDSWEFFRGQEFDPLVARLNPGPVPEHFGKYFPQYELNRTRFRREGDYPSPLTLQAAADWLETNRNADNYLLWVECFDPHEPFDLPEEYLRSLGDYHGPRYNWPNYGPVDVPPEALEHVRKRYAALLAMTDRWLGKLFDVMDKQRIWGDTLVIFTTDHGFMLGEHGLMAKNYMAAYNEVFHIPLLVHLPGDSGGRRIGALTQNTDIFPTVLDYFGIDRETLPNKIHGRSWLPLLTGEQSKIRDYVLYGYFGRNVNITDGSHTYFRAAAGEGNNPLNVYTAMPTTITQYLGPENLTDPSRIDAGPFLSWTNYPVFKIPVEILKLKDKSQDPNARWEFVSQNRLFDLVRDYRQEHPLDDPGLEAEFRRALSKTLREHDCPAEQWLRLNLERE